MSHIRIDKSKALKKWSPVLENMGVSEERLDWMSEMAEYHSINENAYVNATNVAGMGSILNPVVGTLAGNVTGNSNVAGSGDVGQNLLPVAMKIAAQTIGLDLVAVKPTPGPKIDLLYIDFQYDDVNLTSNERPQVFKLSGTGVSTVITNLTTDVDNTTGMSLVTGGLSGGRLFYGITASGVGPLTTQPATLTKVVEFLGFSRIDGFPMFRAFRQANTAGQFNHFAFDATLNTFAASGTMISQIVRISSTDVTSGSVELVSALEDHIPGFTSNFTAAAAGMASGAYPMGRQADDDTYSGVIGPKISSKTVAVGTIEVSSALRRTEIEDIKANTGMDIVQKMESILVNELSQTISKQIVAKIFEMGALNATTAPASTAVGSAVSIFDLDTAYAALSGGAQTLGGENTHAVQRKLITKIAHASNYIATEGRVGPAQYLITNGGLAAALQDIAGYTVNPVKSKLNGQGQLYPVGSIGDISIYVDP